MINNFNESPAVRAGHFLKSELGNRNITQRMFAEEAGVDERTVRRWISDGIHSVDTIWLVADTLGLASIVDIFS